MIHYFLLVDFVSNKAKIFFKKNKHSTVDDLVNFDRNGERSLIVSCGKTTYETIIRIITDYNDGFLTYDKNYIPLKPFPSQGFIVIEEKASPSLLT